MKTHPPIVLPEKYYLDYFESVLLHVEEHYPDILNKAEKSFIRRFRNLSEDARCLFVRLANRRGTYFRMSKIKYAEIADLEAALGLLLRRGFFEKLSPGRPAETGLLLQAFVKQELISMAASYGAEKKMLASFRKMKKPELVRALPETLGSYHLVRMISRDETVVRVGFEEELCMLKFLFFGHIDGDMTQFVVRDIGYIKTEKYDQRKIRAFFKNRQEAEDKLRLSLIYREFKRLRDEQALEAVDIYNWFIKQNLQRSKLSETALPLFDKICLRLGKLLEQQSAFAQALDVFCLTDQPPARERRVRILHKSGQMEAALALCRLMQDAPLNADERFFAADFCDRIRKKKRTRLATDYLRNSESVEIDSDFSKFVEAGALAVFQQQGQEGAFAENYLWRGFFGLLFWDIIFDQDAEAIHHPLQTAPSDFYTPRFLQRREEALIQRLGVLHHPSRFLKIIHHHFNTKTGMSNPMVGWHENLLMLVERCYYYLNADQLGNVLLEMARDLRENTRGFPDLFVWQGSSYCFVEIKSPNDQLSAQQLYWLRFFERQQIRAKVVRVNWQQD